MILLTGGSGALGTELRKLYDFESPTHKEFDITSKESIDKWIIENGTPEMIVHCAAYTDVANAEKNKDLCYNINVRGTANLADLGIPMVYISTEYVFDGDRGNYTEEDTPNPRNFYALTKLLGEFESKRTDHLIIRTILKPKPFEHAAACVDQFTAGDYVDVIAKEIMIAINAFIKDRNVFKDRIINIGTGRKSVFNLASQTRNVIPITVESIGVRLPKDTSVNITRWINFKGTL
jgi:dTDP-4-dehydrorhamnose reductase